MKHKYYDLDDCIAIYKESTGHDKDEVFDAIIAHLTHHVNSILNVMKGTKYYTDRRIEKIMKYNMKRTVSMRDSSEAIYFFQTMSKDLSIDDAKQMIYAEIVSIINSYKYSKITFLQYITFLLPIRIASKLVKKSKDIMNQFSTSFYPSNEDKKEERNPLVNYSRNDENEESMAILSEFMDEKDLQFLEDLANGEPDELISKRYMISYKELRNYKKSIRFRIKNFVLNNEHTSQKK